MTPPTELKNHIKEIEKYIFDPREGLNDDIFFFIGRHTPFINVDALIQLSTGEIVLTWRNDTYTGKGWHIPGGIIRFQETMEERLKKVVNLEIGVELQEFTGPTTTNQIIAPWLKDRSHFISLLFICKLSLEDEKTLHKLALREPNYYLLATRCPRDLLSWHEIYRNEINTRISSASPF